MSIEPESPRPRVLFVVTSLSGRAGGHFYSLKTTAEALRDRSDIISAVEILEVGYGSSGVYESTTVSISRVFVGSALASLSYVSRVLRAGKRFRPTHVHAFDNRSYCLARLIALSTGARVVLTRPGGPNSARFFPAFRDLVVYSEEGRAFYSGLRPGARVHHIPQRVKLPDQDLETIAALKGELDVRGLVLLRIARVGPYYQASIRATLELGRELRSRGLEITTLVVGYVQDSYVESQIRQDLEPNEHLLVDQQYSREAARLIGVSDVVVATGRGLMESAMLGKLVLAPAANAGLPVVVRQGNIGALAAANFSERSEVPEYDRRGELDFLVGILENLPKLRKHQAYNEEVIGPMFDIDYGIKRLIDVYDGAEKEPLKLLNFVDLIKNFGTLLWWYRKFWSTWH